MSIYTDQGYKDRIDYLTSLAVDFALPIEVVLITADLLGDDEDFDGLINMLEDY